MDNMRERERERERVNKKIVIFLNKRMANTFVQNENAVTTLMFYNNSVFSNIHRACGTQVASLAQRYNCRFTLVTGRNWLLHIVPLRTTTTISRGFPSHLSLSYLTIVNLSRSANLIPYVKYPGILFLLGDYYIIEFYLLLSQNKRNFYPIYLEKIVLVLTKLVVLRFVIVPFGYKFTAAPPPYL